MDYFQELIWDLGEQLKMPLHVDTNRACNILLDDHLEIQLQMDSYEEYLIMWAFLNEIPPGKFRENLLTDALKVNGTPYPFGAFAYYEKNNQLILHQFLQKESLSSSLLLSQLEDFIEEAEQWRSSIETNSTIPAQYQRL